MAGYTKLFSSIVTSSIWQEDNATRLVWITLLATADARGIVEASLPGLAHVARVDRDECERALAKLASPDPDSRTKDHDGRRIAECDGGWQILNYAQYREKGRSQDRHEYYREYNRNRRKHPRAPTRTKAHPKTPNAEAEALEKENKKEKDSSAPLDAEFEQDFWPAVPTKIGKGAARKAWRNARRNTDCQTILDGLTQYRSYEARRRQQPDYRPLHPATWLNQERWLDEPESQRQTAEPTACACGCGKTPTIQRDNKWWASSQCYYKETSVQHDAATLG